MNILLFPGSFSPYTDGHYGLVSRYINAAKKQNVNIDKIVIIISSKEREGIDTKSVYKFVSQLYSNDNRFEIRLSGDKGPISEVYKYINIESSKNENQTNNYIFLRSNKDEDSASEDFYKSFGKNGKYELDNVKVIELKNVSDDPILYKNREDENNNKPISATIVREDLRNDDFENFKKSYQIIQRNEITITEDSLKKYFNKWKKEVEPEENLDESFTKKVSKTSINDLTKKTEEDFSYEGQMRLMMQSLREICIKRHYPMEKMALNLGYEKYEIPCCSLERDKGSMEYPEGKLCVYKNDYDHQFSYGFHWDYVSRGLMTQPNEGWTIDTKDKRDLQSYTAYGFDETILIEKVPSKYTRKNSWNGRELVHNAYNVQLAAIQFDLNNRIKLVWKYGCKRDGYGNDDEMKEDFDKCNKNLQKKIFLTFKKKFEIIKNG